MQREAKKYLYDMRQACVLLQQFVAGRTLMDYRSDLMLQSAVERQFEIIGEATNQALKVEPTLRDHISHSRQIVAFRNLLIDGYRFVNPEEVWAILQQDLPRLHEEIAHLLQGDTE